MRVETPSQNALAQVRDRRHELLQTRNSPARNQAVQQLDYDLRVLESAHGDTVGEMAELADQSRRWIRNARLGGRALGIGLGITAMVMGNGPGGLAGQIGLGALCGVVPGVVLGRLAEDAVDSITRRNLQPAEVGPVLARWTDGATAPRPQLLDRLDGGMAVVLGGQSWMEDRPIRKEETRLSPLAQDYLDSLDWAHEALEGQPAGPGKTSALEALKQDRIALTHLPGTELDHLAEVAGKAVQRQRVGRYIGLGLGVALGLAAGMAGYQSGMTALASAGLAVTGGAVGSLVLAAVGADAGRSSAPAPAETLKAAFRWKPLVEEKRAYQARMAAAGDEVAGLKAGSDSDLAIELDEDGLHIGDSFIPLGD